MVVQSEQTKKEKQKRYLSAVFTLLKKRDGLALTDGRYHFNDTELRLLGEVLSAQIKGERLFSTQLAVRLGVTRSAISQIVNRLEGEGVVKRVAAEKDRKIAYIEGTEETMNKYEEDVRICGEFVYAVVERFGEERFDRMCALLQEFIDEIDSERERQEGK